jgi:acyl-CoA thioesterase FadM
VDSLLTGTEVELRPRFEGANIGTWIGFKHVMYLVEEAVLEHLRCSGLAPRQLYEEHGLGVELVDSDVRILHALRLDDVVQCRVVAKPPDGGELRFVVTSFVDRPDATAPGPSKAVSARVRVVLRRRADAGPDSSGLGQFAVSAVDRRSQQPGPGPDGGGYTWRWRIPYFYCHFSERLQHSGYVRLMEEVVDLFLADRGISIRTMLDRRRWIPVVSHARVEMLGEARMEEELHTVFTVEEVFKDVTYTARMDCSVRRGGRLVPTATGRITHGYAEVVGAEWRLVQFDPATVTALRGNGHRTADGSDAGGRGGAA